MKKEAIKYLYHITPIENIAKIKKDGIKCGEDKHIYVLTQLEATNPVFDISVFLTDMIAVRQIFIEEYCIIKIDINGITSNLLPDKVAEIDAAFQKRIKQSVIKPEFLSLYKKRKIDTEAVYIYKECKHLEIFNKFNENSLDKASKNMIINRVKNQYLLNI